MADQPEALRLADALDPLTRRSIDNLTCAAAAAELRRLYAENQSLRAALAQAEPTRSQQMADAGFTPRDNRLQCDECGGKFSRQMLPIHNCPQQAEPVQCEHCSSPLFAAVQCRVCGRKVEPK